MISFAIAAAASGSGKTTITMGLIAALRRRGLRVQPFKTGPDYIDPAYHSKLAGRPCINLDTWMTSDSFVEDSFHRHIQDADVAIIEGVMGLFDGAPDGTGSTASICKLLNVPVLHVIDSGKAAQSAGAVLYGLEHFDPDIQSLGAVFNNICGPTHWKSVTDSVSARCSSPILGYMPKDKELTLPERQLGLLSAHEHGLPTAYIDQLVQTVEAHLDIDALLAQETKTSKSVKVENPPYPVVRLGYAKDEAFCFYYQDNLDLLGQAGIELVPFSPMNDQTLPAQLDGLYFAGGFPEEFTHALASNEEMMQSIREFSGPILAECGGLIYLSKPLVGLIDGSIEMTQSLQACGYRLVTFNHDTILGPQGTQLRGHEFHYSKWVEPPASGFGALQTGEHSWGYADKQIFASYFHIHFGSNPDVIPFFRDQMSS